MQVDKFIDFNGNSVVVTGATSGIGEAIAVELNKYNAYTILVGRDKEKLGKVSQKFKKNTYHLLRLDLAQLEGFREEIKTISKAVGPIYGLCHAAGVVETRPLTSFNADSFTGMMNVNCTAGIELAKNICRRDVMMREGGSLVFISSIYAHVGMAGQIGYSATKGAIVSSVKALATELARRNVRINSISPGMVMTPMVADAMSKIPKENVEKLKAAHPLGIGTPEDVARAVVFLLAPQNRWITGIDLVIDGGYTAI